MYVIRQKVRFEERFFDGRVTHSIQNPICAYISNIYHKIQKRYTNIQYIQYIYINIIKGTSENIMVSKW